MTDYKIPEALKVVLTPIDAQGLHSLGYVVAAETIILPIGEKKELSGIPLEKGQTVTIDYIINGNKTHIVYQVHLEPSQAYVGETTIVVIEGESPDIKSAVGLAHRETHQRQATAKRPNKSPAAGLRAAAIVSLQERIEFLHGEIYLCNKSGLDPARLIADISSLEDSLRCMW